MAEEQEGIVIAIEGNIAKVKASRHSNCENCGGCPGSSALVLDAMNPVGAKPGQRVAVEIKEINMLKAAFIVYVLPLIAMFIGAAAAGNVAERLGVTGIWPSVIGGLAAFVLAVAYVRYYDRSARKDADMQPVIIRILS